MKIRTSTNNNSFHIALNGFLNSSSSTELETVIQNIPSHVSEITFDMSHLTYITSAGLRVLILAGKMVGEGNLYVLNMNRDVQDILKMTGIIDMVQTKKEVAIAKNSSFLA